MASTDVGKLRVVLAAETDRFNKQLERSRKANTKLSKSMRGTAKSANAMSGAMAKLGAVAGGALGARAVFNLAQKYIALGDEISKTSKRLGIGIEALQALQIEAKAGGVETEQLNKALAKFGVNVGEVAALGTGEFKNALDRLKISLVDTGGTVKSIETLLVEFAQKMGNVADQNERLALAADAFGTRVGPRILELLPLWAKGLDAVKKSASELAKITGADQIRALEAQQDALDRLGKAWDAFWLSRLGNLAILAGFGPEEARLEREIAHLEQLPRFLYQAANSGGDLVDKVARLRVELKTLREETSPSNWKKAAWAGTGIFSAPGIPSDSSEGVPVTIPSEMGAFMAAQARNQSSDERNRRFDDSLQQMRLEDWRTGAVDGQVHWEEENSVATGSLEDLQTAIIETETAYTRFADSALNENQLIDASLSTVASGLSNTIASALATGKLDFASFAQSAAASLAQIITQQLIIRSLAAFGLGAADGAVIPGGVQAFAKGGIVSKPTLFAMGGGGVGLMSEAGAEAIMPLKRDKAGRLGVSSSGAGAGGGGGIVVNVVNNSENSPSNDARLARAIGQQVRAAWNAEARRQMQAGGTLNPIGSNV